MQTLRFALIFEFYFTPLLCQCCSVFAGLTVVLCVDLIFRFVVDSDSFPSIQMFHVAFHLFPDI
jgi:hypothetical protein